MKLELQATVTDDNGDKIVSETLTYEGSKSGIVHAIQPMGSAFNYGVSLALFAAKQVPMKDALGNVRTIAKDVIDLKP